STSLFLSIFFPLSLHDALPIYFFISFLFRPKFSFPPSFLNNFFFPFLAISFVSHGLVNEEFSSSGFTYCYPDLMFFKSNKLRYLDRKSSRLNSSHVAISYAVFC